MPCSCCCSECSSPEPTCCGGQYPRLVGVCCEGVWRISGGVCCDGVWQTGPGECCDGVWQTGTGECCGGVWHSGEGYCCGGVWFSDSDPDAPCPDGHTFHRWGEGLQCCGCVPPELFDPELNGGLATTEEVLAALCCPVCGPFVLRNEYGECPGQCCSDGLCSDSLESECAGSWTAGVCCDVGCPTPCCTETDTGEVDCDIAFSTLCEAPTASCESGCVGECCVDGVSQGQTTLPECDSLGGLWGGLGSTTCQGDGDCRSPYSENCCETKQSSGAGLIFIQPYRKRTPPFQGTLRATVTGTTDSPIRVHGVLVGQAGKRCPFTVAFPLCRDRFEIEPVPCGSTFHRVDVTVCWEEVETNAETLNFSACNGLNWSLSDCDKDCATTLVYTGSGATTNASLRLYWDATIQADGSGPLVLTSAITHSGTCDRTLTLSGSSTQANEIRTINDPGGAAVCHVTKDGTGTWRLNAARAFLGTLTVKNGTLQVASSGGAGSTVAIGDTAVGAGGVAKFLLEQGQSASPDFDVLASAGTQAVYIGGANTAGASTYSSGEIRMGRDVTLVAADNGSVFFENSTWAGASPGSPASRNVTIGAAGYEGVVVLNTVGTLATTGTVLVQYGTTVVGSDATLSAGSLQVAQGGVLQVGQGDVMGGGITGNVTNNASLVFNHSNALTYSGAISGTGTLTKSGTGTLTLSGALSYGGTTDITAGSVVTQTLVSGPAKVSSATFTPTSLTVAFSSAPDSGEEYQLLPGATSQTYATVTLTGTAATGTYDSATSTLTID